MNSLYVTVIGDMIDVEIYDEQGRKLDMYRNSDRRVTFKRWMPVFDIIHKATNEGTQFNVRVRYSR